MFKKIRENLNINKQMSAVNKQVKLVTSKNLQYSLCTLISTHKEKKMIFKIPHSKFGTIEADVIDNKLVINKVYHFENAKWDTTYNGYDLWKYDTYFAIYRKDNQYIGHGLQNPYDNRNVFVDVWFSKKPNRNIINKSNIMFQIFTKTYSWV